MARVAFALLALIVAVDALHMYEEEGRPRPNSIQVPTKWNQQKNAARKDHGREYPDESHWDKDDDSDDQPRIDDPTPAYDKPFNLTNGACTLSKEGRYVMEITNVAHGSYYIGAMGFGTPAQTLNMLLDTGSDEIVVKGKGCRGCSGRGYNHSESSTYEINKPKGDPKNGTEEVSYGSGDVMGQHVFDTVHMGPLSGPHMDLLEVSETTIQEFYETSPTALEVIAGMAPGLPEYVGETLASHMEIRHFAQCLPQNSEENGFFILNDKDPRKQGYDGPFMSLGNYYWALNLDGVRFDWTPSQKAARVRGASEAIRLSEKPITMLVDTGTTLLSLPQEVMDKLQEALDSIQNDCAKMDQLPSLAFEIDGVTHSLPPSTYIAEGSDNSWAEHGASFKNKEKEESLDEMIERQKANLFFKSKFLNSKTGTECHLLFTQPINMKSTLGGQVGILGMPFFRNYVVSFDFCQRQIWTKPHYGDCHNVVGVSPSNVDRCADGDWIVCFFQDLGTWLMNLLDGFGSIFSQESTTRQGPRLKYQPGTERISAGARALLTQSSEGGGGLVEL